MVIFSHDPRNEHMFPSDAMHFKLLIEFDRNWQSYLRRQLPFNGELISGWFGECGASVKFKRLD